MKQKEIDNNLIFENPKIDVHFILTFGSRDIIKCTLNITIKDHHLSTFLKYRPRNNRHIRFPFLGSVS